MRRFRPMACVLALSTLMAATPSTAQICPDMPAGRMVGTVYFGNDLAWREAGVMAEIATLDVLVVNGFARFEGLPAAARAMKPDLKILQYAAFMTIPDHSAGDLPSGRPDNPLGQAMYDAFYPDDIARITPTNPDPAVADTAFTAYGDHITLVIDIDNPGVPERLAEIIYDQISGGPISDCDGVFLDGVRVRRTGFGLYGCAEEDRGYAGDPWFYAVDFDRDGIPASRDAGELRSVTDAIIRLTDRLRELGGPCFMVAGNGYDHLGGEYQGSDGRLLDGAFECRFREHFPNYWAGEDQWLYPFGLGTDYPMNHGDDTVWDWASRGAGRDWIPTPAGGYLLLDNMSTRNAPWLCVAAMMVDGSIAMIGQTPGGTSRRQWGGPDPMPRLHDLGAATGPAITDGVTVSRDFEGGRIVMEFSNSPAEDVVRPYGGDTVNAPLGPFKYVVLGTSSADTIYAGGGWETSESRRLLHVDFEDLSWAGSFVGDATVAARVDHSPGRGRWSLRGNLRPGVIDPIAAVAGTAAPALVCRFDQIAQSAPARLFLRWRVRLDDAVWSGSEPGTGRTAALLPVGGDTGLSLALGVLRDPGGQGARGGQAILTANGALGEACAALWGGPSTLLGDPDAPALLPADGSWHKIEVLLDSVAGTLQLWIDDRRLLGTPGFPGAAEHYADGVVPVPAGWIVGGLGLPAVSEGQIDLSGDRDGWACGWQIDEIEVFSGYDADLLPPGSPIRRH